MQCDRTGINDIELENYDFELEESLEFYKKE